MKSQRFNFYLTVVATTVLSIECSATLANERFERWQSGRPYTLAGWATHDYGGGGTLDVAYFLGSGLNTAMDGRCAYNANRTMVDVGDLPLVYMVYANKVPDLEGFIADFEKARKHYSNITALLLGDEVRSVHGDNGLTHMRQIRDWVVNHPDPAVNNLLLITCMPAGNHLSTSDTVRQYFNDSADAMQPDTVLAQMYDIGKPDFYASLQWFADWCRQRDISMWVIGSTWSSSVQGIPSESQLRLQKFTNLAYGVRGMFDFLWMAGVTPSVQDAGYINYDGRNNPTPMYRNVAPINREIVRLGNSIVRLTPTRVYHMDSADDEAPTGGGTAVHHWSDSDTDLPAWQRRRWRLANVTGAVNRNHLLVAFFRDDAGETYFMVVNKDHNRHDRGADLVTRVTLNLHPSVRSIQRLRRDTGQVETIAVNETFAFDLPGGTGDLFRLAGPITASAAFAGVETIVRSKLASSDPPDGGTVGRLAGNVLRFTFDRDARNVHARIRRVGKNGELITDDVADKMTRSLSDDHLTLVYRDVVGVLISNVTYQADLHWADGAPVRFTVLRGDVDGDGMVAATDADAVERAIGFKGGFLHEDLDGDGTVTESDLRFANRTVEPLAFDWNEDFESYEAGALSGQGPWREAETIPGTVLSKSWIAGPASVGTVMSHVVDGARSATCSHGGLFYGNEARFLDHEGAGGVGTLIVDFTARVNDSGFHNHGMHLWSSQDVQGNQGSFACEVVGRAVSFHAGRGIVLGEGTQNAVLDPAAGTSDIAVHYEIDFTNGTITWSCTDVGSKQSKGPFMMRFTGAVSGMDSLSIILRGTIGALDNFRVQGK